MGFYFELERSGEDLFFEAPPPKVFWLLYLICGFALACMGGAAFGLLQELVSKGAIFDRIIVAMCVACIPLYVLAGVKLSFFRKYVKFNSDSVQLGYRLWKYDLYTKRVSKGDVSQIEMINSRPSNNVAPTIHKDTQYFIRGHWKLILKMESGQETVLDKHTERGALRELSRRASLWLSE